MKWSAVTSWLEPWFSAHRRRHRVFIVEGHPRSGWNMGIGWFRVTFGLGQVPSLGIGTVFAERRIYLGWHVVGAVIFTGTFLGRIHLSRLSDRRWHPSLGNRCLVGRGSYRPARPPFLLEDLVHQWPGGGIAVTDPADDILVDGGMGGVEGLRVADASVTPAIIEGQTHVPAVLIEEKTADLMRC